MFQVTKLATVLTTSNPGPIFADEHGTLMTIMVIGLCMVGGEVGGELKSVRVAARKLYRSEIWIAGSLLAPRPSPICGGDKYSVHMPALFLCYIQKQSITRSLAISILSSGSMS